MNEAQITALLQILALAGQALARARQRGEMTPEQEAAMDAEMAAISAREEDTPAPPPPDKEVSS